MLPSVTRGRNLQVYSILFLSVFTTIVFVLKAHSSNGPSIFPFPIALLCRSRHDYLRRTLRALSAADGYAPNLVRIFQQGNLSTVSEVVRASQLHCTLLPEKNSSFPHVRITYAYELMLKYMFIDYFPTAEYLVILEEDILISRDALTYFHACSSLFRDSSVYIVSAFNTFGFPNTSYDSSLLLRTEYFEHLGWMMPRSLYKEVISKGFPTENWDWWFRRPDVRLGRYTVYPDVPRAIHIGENGSYVSAKNAVRFQHQLNSNISGSVATYHAHHIAYYSQITMLIRSGKHTSLQSFLSTDPCSAQQAPLVVFYCCPFGFIDQGVTCHNFSVIMKHIGIPDALPFRNVWNGIHITSLCRRRIILVSSTSSFFYYAGTHLWHECGSSM